MESILDEQLRYSLMMMKINAMREIELLSGNASQLLRINLGTL